MRLQRPRRARVREGHTSLLELFAEAVGQRLYELRGPSRRGATSAGAAGLCLLTGSGVLDRE